MTKSSLGHEDRTCHGSCAMAGVQESDVLATLDEGHYPVIEVCLGEDGMPCLKAVPAKGCSKYVAISHVW